MQQQDDPRVHSSGVPGSRNQPAMSSATSEISTSERRMLSRIFQRESAESRLGSGPSGPGTVLREPAEDLPVAADPAVLAPREREIARRIVVVQLDVGDETRARERPFDEVVAEQRVLGKAPVRSRPRTHRRRRSPSR